MSDVTCPGCGTPVEDTRWIGEITVVLEPCGHQVDEPLYEDLVRSSS